MISFLMYNVANSLSYFGSNCNIIFWTSWLSKKIMDSCLPSPKNSMEFSYASVHIFGGGVRRPTGQHIVIWPLASWTIVQNKTTVCNVLQNIFFLSVENHWEPNPSRSDSAYDRGSFIQMWIKFFYELISFLINWLRANVICKQEWL